MLRMDNVIKTIRVSFFLLRQEFMTIRTYIVLIVMAGYIYFNIEPIKNFSYDMNVSVTPLAIVFILNEFTCQIVILLGLLILISSAPFKTGEYKYIVSRTGYNTWAVGTIIFIIEITFIYVLYLLFVSIVSFVGCMDFSFEWGKIWATLARTNAGENYGIVFNVNNYIIGNYEAKEALLLSMILEWVCMIWVTLCAHLFSSFVKKGVGILVAGLFIFLDTMIYNSWAPWVYRFSPVTLAELSYYTKSNMAYGINFKYSIGFFIISICGFILLIIYGYSKENKFIEKCEVN